MARGTSALAFIGVHRRLILSFALGVAVKQSKKFNRG
jgi:hypothetical protein